MDHIFADRISDVPRSFIREILKVAIDPEVISFAGGLPNRDLFPLKEIQTATNRVFESSGRDALQYSASEGLRELRESISIRYREKQGLNVPVDNILITNGSQQGLDLLGKTLLNEGDSVIIEEPGYLGAIQSFSVYRSTFYPVPLTHDGMDIPCFREALSHKPKLIYTVPNFQNPTGISYPEDNRCEIAALVHETNSLLIEDNPYGDLRFSGTPKSSFWKLLWSV
jgi:2-aminoadipate transaminase